MKFSTLAILSGFITFDGLIQKFDNASALTQNVLGPVLCMYD
jgi:hypothetical protein